MSHDLLSALGALGVWCGEHRAGAGGHEAAGVHPPSGVRCGRHEPALRNKTQQRLAKFRIQL